MKYLFFLLTISFLCFTEILAQPPSYGGGGHYQHSDTAKPHPKPEKGPNHGKMLKNNGLKLEMLLPSNTKKQEVSYFVFDTLSNPIDAKTYTGTVKYVFGGPNQYIEVNLIPSGQSNQYVATLEDWKDYKKAIITLKANGKIQGTFVFFNTMPEKTKTSQGPPSGGGHTGQHGGSPHGGGGGVRGGGY